MVTPKVLEKQPDRSHNSTSAGTMLLGELTGVDLTTTGLTSIYTADSTRRAVVTYATVECKTATAVTAPATARFLTGGFPVFASQSMLGLTDVGKVWMWPAGVGSVREVQPSADLFFDIVSAAAATAQTADIKVYGYEL
jgi:hypothetical protein